MKTLLALFLTCFSAFGGSTTYFDQLAAAGFTNSGLTASQLIGTDANKGQQSVTTSAFISSSISDETGSGALVFGTSPTIVTPTIASFANANHNHQASAGGGTLDVSAIASGAFTLAGARFANNGTTTTLLHGNASGNPSFGAVAEADLGLTDVTTANASTSAHGFLKKLPNDDKQVINGIGNWITQTNIYEFALSDETTAITTGTAKVSWRAPHAMTLKDVRASLTTVSSSGIPTVNIKEAGVTIFSTKLTIDATELTSTTAAAAYAFSDTSIADDALITFDIDVAGTGATGLKVKIYYTR